VFAVLLSLETFFGHVEVIFGFLVVSKFFSCQGKERERINAIMYIMYVSHGNKCVFQQR